ncbi:MAG: hypothetical protein WKF37_20070 [Bryobacteraceae bacterium]
MHPPLPKKDSPSGWRERLAALRNIPPLLRMVWSTSPRLACASISLRLLLALLPVAVLWTAKLIIDQLVAAVAGQPADTRLVWTLVGVEVALAVVSDATTRAAHLCDSLLGDRFTNHVSLRMMEHAAALDLVSFEDPVFYDKMERARRQTTGRLGMLGDLTTVCQQLVTLVSLSAGVIWFSPWFLLLLLVAVIPAFLGETHFAMLSYSLLYRSTPERRHLDYLRMLGASNASAKEVKIFGLGPYLTERARQLFERFYRENHQLALKRAATGTALNLLPTLGYYVAYVYPLSNAFRRT